VVEPYTVIITFVTVVAFYLIEWVATSRKRRSYHCIWFWYVLPLLCWKYRYTS